MGKTKNRTERIKKEMEEKDGEIVELKQQLQQLKDENQSLRLSLQQQQLGVAEVSASRPLSDENTFIGVFSRATPSSTLPSPSTSISSSTATTVGGSTLSHSSTRSIFSSIDPTCFSNTIFRSSNPFSDTPSIFGSSSPFSGTPYIFGSSNPFAGSGFYSFRAVRPETHLEPSPTLESERITSATVRKEPRRFKRVNRERKVVEETSADQVLSSINEECVKDEPTFERMVLEEMVLPGSVVVVEEENSEADHVTYGKEVHSNIVEIDDALMSASLVPEANAICDGEIAEQKVVEDICICIGEVEAEECSISANRAENVSVNDLVEEVEKLSNGDAYDTHLNDELIPEGGDAEKETFNAGELGKAWLVEKEEMSNDKLNRILRLSEALNEKVDEELDKIKNKCNTKLVKKEKVEELMERVRKKEESVKAMLVDNETKLHEMKRFVTDLEEDKVSHRIQIHQLRQEKKEQLRLKEEVERKLETTRSECKAILREREEVEEQLVEMLTIVNELQQQNLTQRDEIHRLQKGANTRRGRKLWPKVASFFVFAATSVAFILCRP